MLWIFTHGSCIGGLSAVGEQQPVITQQLLDTTKLSRRPADCQEPRNVGRRKLFEKLSEILETPQREKAESKDREQRLFRGFDSFRRKVATLVPEVIVLLEKL